MTQYLVSGNLYFRTHSPLPFSATATTEPGEVMDMNTLRRAEEILLAEHLSALPPNTDISYRPYRVYISSFQPFETQAVAQPAAEPHLNECSVVLPPVDSPLLIEIAPGVLVRATRPAHAESKLSQLAFDLESGRFYGRPRWTHP